MRNQKRWEVHPSSVISPAVTHYPLRRALPIINISVDHEAPEEFRNSKRSCVVTGLVISFELLSSDSGRFQGLRYGLHDPYISTRNSILFPIIYRNLSENQTETNQPKHFKVRFGIAVAHFISWWFKGTGCSHSFDLSSILTNLILMFCSLLILSPTLGSARHPEPKP